MVWHSFAWKLKNFFANIQMYYETLTSPKVNKIFVLNSMITSLTCHDWVLWTNLHPLQTLILLFHTSRNTMGRLDRWTRKSDPNGTLCELMWSTKMFTLAEFLHASANPKWWESSLGTVRVGRQLLHPHQESELGPRAGHLQVLPGILT